MKFREIKVNEELITRVALALKKGEITNGEYVDFVEQKMAEVANTAFAIAVSSGTMALKIALDALGVKQGDKVLVPDITFVACASVVIELGAFPVFVDVDPDTFLMDIEDVKRKLEDNQDARCIMAVRMGGEEVKGLEDLGYPVVYDSAHSMDPIPLHASAVTYSFHPSKIVSGIEGGCICTNDPELARKGQILRNFGFTPGTRVVDDIVGYKGNMTNISAAMITTNLFNLNVILNRRGYIRDQFNMAFGKNRLGLGMYLVTVKDPDKVCEKLGAIRHYPKPLSEMIYGMAQNKKAKWVADHLVSLPFHEHMTLGDIEEIRAIIPNELLSFNEER